MLRFAEAFDGNELPRDIATRMSREVGDREKPERERERSGSDRLALAQTTTPPPPPPLEGRRKSSISKKKPLID